MSFELRAALSTLKISLSSHPIMRYVAFDTEPALVMRNDDGKKIAASSGFVIDTITGKFYYNNGNLDNVTEYEEILMDPDVHQKMINSIKPLYPKTGREILMDNLRLFTPTKSDPSREVTAEGLSRALSVSKNIEKFGYTLSPGLILELSKLSKEDIKENHDSLIYLLTEATGLRDFNTHDLFYPNFPEEIMEKSDFELYLNAFLYYSVSQSEETQKEAEILRSFLVSEKVERPEKDFLNPVAAKNIIGFISEKDGDKKLRDLMNDRIHGNGMSPQQLDEVMAYKARHGKEFYKLIRSEDKFNSKENLVKLAHAIYKEESKTGHVNLSQLPAIKDFKDVITLAALISNDNLPKGKENRIPLGRDKIVFKLHTKDKTMLKGLLNNCPNLFFDTWKDKELSKHFFKFINTKDKCPERVAQAAKYLRNNQKLDERGKEIRTPGRILEDINKGLRSRQVMKMDKAVEDYRKFVKNFPGFAIQNVQTTMLSIPEEVYGAYKEEMLNVIRRCEEKVPVLNVMRAIKFMDRKDTGVQIYTQPNGSMYAKAVVEDDRKKAVLSDVKGALEDYLVSSIKASGLDLGKVYIDERLKDVKIPTREIRDASGRSTLTPYTEIPCDDKKNLLTLGIYWEDKEKNGEKRRVDVDLHARAYDKDLRYLEDVGYYNLKSPWAIHSGDYTSAPNGATEAILIDKAKAKEKRIAYIFSNVHNFSGYKFSDMDRCDFLYEEKDGSIEGNRDLKQIQEDREGWGNRESGKIMIKGEVFEPDEVKEHIALTQDSQSCSPFVYDVEKDRIIWIDTKDSRALNYYAGNDRVTINAEALKLYKREVNCIASMYEVFEYFAKASGEIVEDIEQADTSFTLNREEEGLKTGSLNINSRELDKISRNFMGVPELHGNGISLQEREVLEKRDEMEKEEVLDKDKPGEEIGEENINAPQGIKDIVKQKKRHKDHGMDI